MERSTWITVSIKAFISESEIADRLGLQNIEDGDNTITPIQQLADISEYEIHQVMNQLIREKLGELMPHDVPFKLYEVVID